MQDKLEDNQEGYCSLTHEYWCDLLSTIKVKDNRKMAATQINNIDYDRPASHYDSGRSVEIPRKNKARTGVLRKNKGTKNKALKHHSTQRHCMI